MLSKAWKDYSTWLLVYSLSLVLSLPAFVGIFKILNEKIGSSAEVERLVGGFDFITWDDLWRLVKKDIYEPILVLLLCGFIFLVVSIYLSGGMISRVEKGWEKSKWSYFFQQCNRMFFKYLLLFIYTAILCFVLFLLSGLVFFVLNLMTVSGDSRSFVLWMSPGVLFLFGSLLMALCIGDYARVFLYKNETLGTSAAFFSAFSYVLKHKVAWLRFFVLVAMGVLLLLLYLALESALPTSTALQIGIVILLQQAYHYLRLVLRYFHYGLAWEFLDRFPAKNLVKADLVTDINLGKENGRDSEQGDPEWDSEPGS